MSYIKRIEPRRVEIADVETGLVFGLLAVPSSDERKDHSSWWASRASTPIPMNFNPFDLPAAHIFKVWGGKIHEIEAMGFTMPYNSKTGWEK